EERVREHIKYLASDKLAGRRPGTEGNRLAAEYEAEQFELAHLVPLPGEFERDAGYRKYFHLFDYVAGVSMGAGNSLKLNYGGGGIVFINRPEDSAALVPFELVRNFTGAELPALFASSGVFSSVKDGAGRTLAQIQKRIDSLKIPESWVLAGMSGSMTAEVNL